MITLLLFSAALTLCIRAAPLPFLPTETMELHNQQGQDVKSALPGMASLGFGDVHKTVSRFVPAGTKDFAERTRTYNANDRPNLGYMNRETAGGRSAGSKSLVNVPGLGRFEYADEKEQGTGILDFSQSLFPYLQLPPLKEDPDEEKSRGGGRGGTAPMLALDGVDRKHYGQLYELPSSPPSTTFSPFGPSLIDDAILPENQRAPEPYTDAPSIIDHTTPASDNPFDDIETREFFRNKASNARRSPMNDILERAVDELFEKKTKEVRRQSVRREVDRFRAAAGAPASSLGIERRELFALCAQFAPIAEQNCYKSEVAPEFLDKCQGYAADCVEYQQQAKPLGAIANSFHSGVGLTYGSVGIDGIPYYPINDEGGVGAGNHGKVDFGSYGGGYSSNAGVRDFFSETTEGGANWYEGLYGSKSGWSVPIVQALGAEGGGGTMVNVPVKEGEFGKPIQASTGYFVGPYFGIAKKVGVDWLQGGVSAQEGFNVPLAGISVQNGIGIGFPSVSTLLRQWQFIDPAMLATEGIARGVSTSNWGSSSNTLYG